MKEMYAILTKGIFNNIRAILDNDCLSNISIAVPVFDDNTVNLLALLYNSGKIAFIKVSEEDVYKDSFGRHMASNFVIDHIMSRYNFISWYIDTYGIKNTNLSVTDILINLSKFPAPWIEKCIEDNLFTMMDVCKVKLPIDFIQRNKDRLIWQLVYTNTKLDPGILDILFDIYKPEGSALAVSFCQNLSEDFMDKYRNELDWDILSKVQKMSVDFMILHHTRLNWYSVFQNPNISEEDKKFLGSQLIIKNKTRLEAKDRWDQKEKQ